MNFIKDFRLVSLVAGSLYMAGMSSIATADPSCSGERAKDLAGRAVMAIRALPGNAGLLDGTNVISQDADGYKIAVSAKYPGVIGSDSYEVIVSSTCQIYKVEYEGSLE